MMLQGDIEVLRGNISMKDLQALVYLYMGCKDKKENENEMKKTHLLVVNVTVISVWMQPLLFFVEWIEINLF